MTDWSGSEGMEALGDELFFFSDWLTFHAYPATLHHLMTDRSGSEAEDYTMADRWFRRNGGFGSEAVLFFKILTFMLTHAILHCLMTDTPDSALYSVLRGMLCTFFCSFYLFTFTSAVAGRV